MNDTHHQIVADIVATMEEGVMPWLQTWTGGGTPGMPTNADTVRAMPASTSLCSGPPRR